MENVFFTADHHFYHRRLAVRRGFLYDGYREMLAMGMMGQDYPQQCLEEMSELMVERWNSRVRRNDRVYYLGDLFFGTIDWAERIAKRLNGRIYFIRGNHDKIAEHKRIAPRFEWIKDYASVKIGDQKIYLCHYAFRTWNCMHHGSWNLHGHSHGSLFEYPDKKQLDVGVDCWDYYPAAYEEIKQRMASKLPFVPVDHHHPNDMEEE